MSALVAVNVTIYMGLVPLAWLLLRESRWGLAYDDGWWWLASAFAVSWLADVVAIFLPHRLSPFPSLLYPIAQSGIVAAVLLPKTQARVFIATMVLAGGLAVALETPTAPDALVRTVAWLGIAGFVWRRPALGSLRTALLVCFGLGWVLWCVHLWCLVVPTWYVYQAGRLLGLLWFCWAARSPVRALSLVR